MGASILAHFSRPDRALGVNPKIGYSYPRLGSGKGFPGLAVTWHRFRRLARKSQTFIGEERGPLSGPKSRLGMPQFEHILRAPIARWGWLRKLAILSRDYGPNRGMSDVAADRPRFPRVARKSRAFRLKLTASSFWAIMADTDGSILAHFSRSDRWIGVSPKIGYSYPRLRPEKGAPLVAAAWP